MRVLASYALAIPIGLVAFTCLQVLLFRIVDPPATPYMLFQLLKGSRIEHQWRSLEEISPYLQQAVMASEDQRFPTHHGFDWRQIQIAVHEHRDLGRSRGASTITMQVAKNLYLWHGRSWLRKGLEAYYTIIIELFWPKWRIMEVYLNIAEWGRGIFGAQAAARSYYRRPASALTRRQAAAMAAVLPNPRKWSPAKPTRYIRKRMAAILRQMGWFAPYRK